MRGTLCGRHMASVERKPIIGVWGEAPIAVQGQRPGCKGSLKLKGFQDWNDQKATFLALSESFGNLRKPV